MKPFCHLFLFLLLAVIFSISNASAQMPTLLAVPDFVTGSGKTDLEKQRADLSMRLATLRQDAKAYNDKCGNRDLPADDPLTKECLAEKARLDQVRENFVKDANEYNSRVRALSPRIGGIGKCRGRFYLITPDGRKLTGSEATNSPITLGTHVFTGSDGYVQLLLLDGTVFTVGSDSDMVLDEFVYDPSTSIGKITARLTKGVFSWVTGKMARQAEKQLHVPTGTIGVRGTDFEVSVEPNGAGYVKLFSGKLDITVKKTGNTFTMDAGQMVKVDADGNYGLPTPLDSAPPAISGRTIEHKT